MTNKTTLINNLIEENNFTSYLEIGLGDHKNFDSIKVHRKVGVDPETTRQFRLTSDNFFKVNDLDYDLIFIDGLHHADQVERDIINSYNVLTEGGIILIHDIRPFDEPSQRVPRETKNWMGDVWRCWYGLKNTYPDLSLQFIDERCGIGMIKKEHVKIQQGFTDYTTPYEEYNKNKGWEVI